MVFKKLHLGSASFTKDSLEDLKTHLLISYEEQKVKKDKSNSNLSLNFFFYY